MISLPWNSHLWFQENNALLWVYIDILWSFNFKHPLIVCVCGCVNNILWQLSPPKNSFPVSLSPPQNVFLWVKTTPRIVFLWAAHLHAWHIFMRVSQRHELFSCEFLTLTNYSENLTICLMFHYGDRHKICSWQLTAMQLLIYLVFDSWGLLHESGPSWNNFVRGWTILWHLFVPHEICIFLVVRKSQHKVTHQHSWCAHAYWSLQFLYKIRAPCILLHLLMSS